MRKINTRSMVMIAMLAGISVVLFYTTEFSIIPSTPWLKMDFSDLPVLVAGFSFGPIAGLIVAFIKNLVHLTFARNSGFVGELANFLYASLLMLPIALWKPEAKTKKIVLAIGTIIFSSLVMIVFNYYIIFPFFGIPKEGAWLVSFQIYLPFNMIKGTILLTLFSLYILPINRRHML